MRKLVYAFALGFAILSVQAGIPLGTRWTEASTGLQEEDKDGERKRLESSGP